LRTAGEEGKKGEDQDAAGAEGRHHAEDQTGSGLS